MPKRRAPSIKLALALLLAAPGTLLAADLRVDELELLTNGALNQGSGSFEVGSRLFFDLSMQGGDKFAGLLRLDFLNSDIESALNMANTSLPSTATTTQLADRINNLISPRLRTVSVTARSIFGLPLDFSYFVGNMDTFGSGDDFTSLFGAAPFGTELRGPMVYPNGVGGDKNIWYDGIHAANGTGFRLGTTPRLSASTVTYLYLYQDSNVGPGTWSGDLRFLANSKNAKVEVFAGATTGGAYGIYRGGLLFYATSGEVGEFLAQAGVTRWDSGSSFGPDNLFFLFEPRINMGKAQAAITGFYHPAYYLQKDFTAAGERSAFDLSFNLRFGDISRSGAQGGFETLFSLRQETSNPLAIDAAPYYSLISGGVRWDFKLNLRVFPFPSPWYGMFEPFIGLKTSY